MAILPWQNASDFQTSCISQVTDLSFVSVTQDRVVALSASTVTYAFWAIVACIAIPVISCVSCVYIKANKRRNPYDDLNTAPPPYEPAENLSFHIADYKPKDTISEKPKEPAQKPEPKNLKEWIIANKDFLGICALLITMLTPLARKH